jgi:hypothetical protein
MELDSVDVVGALTTQGDHFQATWSRFMFNIEMAMDLKKKQVSKEKIIEVLNAGSAYLGQGWSTGKASKRLYELSGVAIVKPQFEPYRDTWLYSLALLLNVDLPPTDLAADCAEAAFALAHLQEHPGDKASPPPNESDSDEEEVRFGWEEAEQPLPRELQELWQRAATGTQRIEVRRLLEQYPRLQGIPSRAAENQLIPEFKKRQDSFLKAADQHLLNGLRLMAHRFLASPATPLELQLFQYLGELHFKFNQERRELAVPGIRKSGEVVEGLFSEEDVKSQRLDASIQRISMFQKKVFTRGGFSGPSGSQPFRPTSTPLTEGSSFTSGHYKPSWRGRSGKGFGKGGRGFKGWSSNTYSSSWKGASWKGKGTKGVFPFGHGGNIKGHGGTVGDGPLSLRSIDSPQSLRSPKAVPQLVAGTCPQVCVGSDPKKG